MSIPSRVTRFLAEKLRYVKSSRAAKGDDHCKYRHVSPRGVDAYIDYESTTVKATQVEA